MATVEFRYDPKNTAWFTANAAMVLKAGEPAYHDTTGLFKLGDGVTALSALSFLPTVSASTPTIQQVLTAGQVATTTIETTGFIKTGGLSTQFLKADGTVDSNVYGVGNALTSNPLSQFAATTSSQLAGVISDETGSGALVFGTSPTFTTSIITPNVTGVSGNLTLTNAIQSSGAITQFTFTNVANTNQTATTNIPNFRISGANKQWATGTVPLQYFTHLTANTVSAVAASTFTNVYGLFVEAATAGTNATITNNWGIGVNGGGIIVRGSSGTVLDVGNTFSIFNVVSSTGICSAYNLYVTNGAMTIQTVTPTLIFNNSTVQIRRNSNSLFLDTYDDLTVRNTLSSYDMLVLRGTKTTGASNSFVFTTPSNTNQTLSTEISGVLYNNYSRQWATGNITTQREQYIKTVTYTAIGASVITNAFGKYIEAPTASTNVTITNNYALGLAGSLKINDTFNIVFDTTNGSKIATSPTQKLSFWNATPIVQPTTAVASATVVSGAGGTVKHDDTFDGYTVEKVVRALRNIGLLA